MSAHPHGPVVVGMDGSIEAVRAAEYGAWEAHRRRVPLRLVFGHQPAPMWGPGILLSDDFVTERPWIRDLLETEKKHVEDAYPDLSVEAVAVSGSAAGTLVEESRTASLMVVGTHASGGLRGHLSGSVAAQVASHAHAPVVVVRALEDPATDFDELRTRPVVVGLDGSEESDRAMAFAVDAAVARGVPVDAVFVWAVLPVHDIGPITPDTFDVAEVEAKAARLLSEATSGWSALYPDLVISHRAIHGVDPVEALVRASANAGMVVVGSRGHGGFLGLRLGSTVDGLIRYSAAPVAVVRGDTD